MNNPRRARLDEAWGHRETAPDRAADLLRADEETQPDDDEEARAARHVVHGYLAFREARLADALAAVAAALPALAETSPWRARALNVRGGTLAELGEYEQAVLTLREQVRVSREGGDTASEVAALHDLGFIHARTDLARGEAYLAQAEALAERSNDLLGLAYCACSRAEARRARGEAVADLLAAALERARRAGHVPLEVLVLTYLGEDALARGERPTGERLLRAALDVEQASPAFGRPLWVAVPTLARLLLLDGRRAEALELLRAQLERAERAGMITVIAAVHELLAELYEADGQPAAALHHLRAYLRVFKQENADEQARHVRALEVLHRTELAEQAARAERARNGELSRALAELAEVHREVERASVTDALTGVHNRHYFLTRGAALLREATAPSSVALLDLDHFKRINDTLGHAVGDAVLRTFAAHLREHLSASRVVARFGGEEFVVLFPETPPEQAAAELEHVRTSMCRARFPDLPGPVSFTCGVASCRHPDLSDALSRADALLYEGKRSGRGQVRFEEGVVLPAALRFGESG